MSLKKILFLSIFCILSLKKILFLSIFFKELFIYFWLHWVFIATRGLSLVAASGGYSLVVVCGLFVAVASLVSEHRLWGTWASVVAAYRLSCPVADGIFPDQGSNLCPLHWQVDS